VSGDAALEPWTPGAVLSLYHQGLANPKRTPFVAVGVLRFGNGKLYKDWTFDKLEDESGSAWVTVRVPSSVRARVSDGDLVRLRGYLEPQLKPEKGCIELVFVVSELLSQAVRALDAREARRLEVLRSRLEHPVKAVDALVRERLVRGEHPRIALILGAVAVVGDDVRRAMGSALGAYDLLEVRSNFSRPEGLRETLQRTAQLEGVDVVALVRGGGSGLEALDDPDLAQSALELRVPLVVALGHAVDVPLLARVADASFDTPSSLGAHWRTLAEDVARAEEGSLAAVRRRTEASLLMRIAWLERQVTRSGWIALGGSLLGVFVGVVLAALLRR
jgi:exodeoxyribonuclease VII large subunit